LKKFGQKTKNKIRIKNENALKKKDEVKKSNNEKIRLWTEEIRKAAKEKERLILEEIRKAENKFIQVESKDFRQQLCLEASGLSQGLADHIARKLEVSSSSISLRRINLMKDSVSYCHATFDTPKGLKNCGLLYLLTNKKGDYIFDGGCF